MVAKCRIDTGNRVRQVIARCRTESLLENFLRLMRISGLRKHTPDSSHLSLVFGSSLCLCLPCLTQSFVEHLLSGIHLTQSQMWFGAGRVFPHFLAKRLRSAGVLPYT